MEKKPDPRWFSQNLLLVVVVALTIVLVNQFK